MSDDQNAKQDALLPSGERGLIAPQSAGLARRGLELAASVLGPKPIRVLLVDHMPETLEILRGFLHGQTDIEIVGYAQNGVEAINKFDALLPDVMATCIHMYEMDGFVATAEICKRHPDAKVIILSIHDEPEYRGRGMSVGAKLYLVKPISAEDFTSAIRQVGRQAGEARVGLPSSPIISRVGEFRCFEGHRGWGTDAKFSPDDRYIISASLDHTARLWDVRSGKEIARFTYEKNISSVAFSPDGRFVLLGCSGGRVLLWDIREEDEEKKVVCLYVHDDDVLCVAFSYDGRMVTSGGRDNQVYVCEIGPEMSLHNLNGHKADVSTVGFSADGLQIISGSHDGTLRLWKVGSDREVSCYYGPGKFITSAAFSSDSRYILSAHGEHRVPALSGSSLPASVLIQPALLFDSVACLWEVGSGNRIDLFDASPDLIERVAFSHKGYLALIAVRDGTIHLWDIMSRHEVDCSKERAKSYSTSVDFSHDDRFAVSSERDGNIRLWKLPSKDM